VLAEIDADDGIGGFGHGIVPLDKAKTMPGLRQFLRKLPRRKRVRDSRETDLHIRCRALPEVLITSWDSYDPAELG
jgi:hypothetical protein